MLTFNNHDKFG